MKFTRSTKKMIASFTSRRVAYTKIWSRVSFCDDRLAGKFGTANGEGMAIARATGRLKGKAPSSARPNGRVLLKLHRPKEKRDRPAVLE